MNGPKSESNIHWPFLLCMILYFGGIGYGIFLLFTHYILPLFTLAAI